MFTYNLQKNTPIKILKEEIPYFINFENKLFNFINVNKNLKELEKVIFIKYEFIDKEFFNLVYNIYIKNLCIYLDYCECNLLSLVDVKNSLEELCFYTNFNINLYNLLIDKINIEDTKENTKENDKDINNICIKEKKFEENTRKNIIVKDNIYTKENTKKNINVKDNIYIKENINLDTRKIVDFIIYSKKLLNNLNIIKTKQVFFDKTINKKFILSKKLLGEERIKKYNFDEFLDLL